MENRKERVIRVEKLEKLEEEVLAMQDTAFLLWLVFSYGGRCAGASGSEVLDRVVSDLIWKVWHSSTETEQALSRLFDLKTRV